MCSRLLMCHIANAHARAIPAEIALARRSAFRLCHRRAHRTQIFSHTYRCFETQSQRQEYDSASSVDAVLAAAERHEQHGQASPATRVFAFRATAHALAQNCTPHTPLATSSTTGAQEQHLVPAARWGIRPPAPSLPAPADAAYAQSAQGGAEQQMMALMASLGFALPMSWSLLTPVVVAAASVLANTHCERVRMHARWLLSQAEDRLLDLSFDNDDASVLQSAVILSSGVNAGMCLLRSQAVLSASLTERAHCMPPEAIVRLLKAVAMSGCNDDELARALMRRVSQLVFELSLPQLADVAFALAIYPHIQDEVLQELCFTQAMKAVITYNIHSQAVHPYCLFQLYLVHVASSSSGRGAALRSKLEATLPKAHVRRALSTIRYGAEQTQAFAYQGRDRSSGSWHLAPASWRAQVWPALCAIAGPDATRIRADTAHANRFRWSYVLPHMGFVLHCAPSSAYMFGPVANRTDDFGRLCLPAEHELQHSLRPSIHTIMQASCHDKSEIGIISFSAWANAGSVQSQTDMVYLALADLAERKLQRI